MAFFAGEFEQTIDAKHRLAISAFLRDQADPKRDGKDFYVVLGPDKHLWLYPDKHYEQLQEFRSRTPLPTRRQKRMDFLFAFSRRVKADAQGRIVLPEKSMERAKVGREVTLVGMQDRIEIWPTDEWERAVGGTLEGDNYDRTFYEAAEWLEQVAAAQQKSNARQDTTEEQQDESDSS